MPEIFEGMLTVKRFYAIPHATFAIFIGTGPNGPSRNCYTSIPIGDDFDVTVDVADGSPSASPMTADHETSCRCS